MFFGSRQRREWLNPKVSRHISHVYYTLSVYIYLFGLSSWLGTYINISYLNLEVAGALGLILSVFSLDLISDKILQVSYMIPIFMGLLFSPSIYNSNQIDPMIVFIATITTSVIFASMSAVAYYVQLVDMFYIYGFLTSCLNIAIVIIFINLFIKSETLNFSNMFFLLFIFILYVVYDTTLMIKREYQKELNKYEVVIDSLRLFGGFANIFIKILSLFVSYISNLRSIR